MASNVNINRRFLTISKDLLNTEGVSTITSFEQSLVERDILKIYLNYVKSAKSNGDSSIELLSTKHRELLRKWLIRLNSRYECLDASRTWIAYWVTHASRLLHNPIHSDVCDKVVRFIATCQHPDGGFGGGPGQYAHLGTTYAAVNTLCLIGTETALNTINRQTLHKYLYSLRCPNQPGGFYIHHGGEVDVRASYCAIAVARLTNVFSNELFANTAEWIVGCQSYEGGFSGTPEMEAHGGYTYCGLAALMLLGKHRLVDVRSLLRWLVNKQMRLEGGFQGRTNKLVDACYSFWQGACFTIINALLEREFNVPSKSLLFNSRALQEYVLLCSQNRQGAFCDKPPKAVDAYHTCYALSGLSTAQYPFFNDFTNYLVVGSTQNRLSPIHPLYNINIENVEMALKYFEEMPAYRLISQNNGSN